MDVDYQLNYPREKEATSELFGDEQIKENVARNDKENEFEDDSSILELSSNNRIA